jgi:hypothetical protein
MMSPFLLRSKRAIINLVLNGVGAHVKLFMDVYVAGLYPDRKEQ